MTSNSRKVASWVRVSTDEQKVDAQSDVIERYVAAKGWNVVKRFEEHGISGAAKNRKTVDAILHGARKREFTAVVLFRGDRAFRTAARAVCSSTS